MQRLDYVFVGPKMQSLPTEVGGDVMGAAWSMRGYAVLPNLFDDGVYRSDHRAIVADLTLD